MTESKGRWTGKISEERQEETQLQAQCMMATVVSGKLLPFSYSG